MAKCKYCGAEVDSKYCPYCGIVNREYVEEPSLSRPQGLAGLIAPEGLEEIKNVFGVVVDAGKKIVNKIKENINEDLKVKFCKNCGRKLKEDSLFCDKCGSNFSEEE